MGHNENPDIKLRPDGSIDIAHYMMIGRQKRAEQAQFLAKNFRPKRKPISFRFWSLGAPGTP
ncbi:hypothetical protein C1J03_14560 [Sulfitobacter sp. SK012]|uniref:hypothetical protein n=1 Tax=Sulfitobacter sp. SK012 TaxID=1389005 RepID=UPI000E0ADF17|nr:hypothetical protein [Sulfitobacter sp. SK012]AXI47129.1 hypothetical protein C1J03_14560 [Sulfitobacter sp. SK012]